eukprot:1011729-Pyramimonas_sp.AAC.1
MDKEAACCSHAGSNRLNSLRHRLPPRQRSAARPPLATWAQRSLLLASRADHRTEAGPLGGAALHLERFELTRNASAPFAPRRLILAA